MLRKMTLCEVTLFYLLLLVIHAVFGDEVKTVSVMEGDSVTLNTNVTEIQRHDVILWMFGPQETRIAEIYKQNIDITHSKTTFGDRLKLDSQTGSLTITNIRITDSELYKLTIISNTETSYRRFNVTVFAHLCVPDISRNSSQCSSSSERSSSSRCELVCSVMNVTHVTLSWYKGNSLLSSISVSDLSIRLSLPLEVEYQDTNTYSCVLSNPVTHQTQHLNITQHCQPCSGNDRTILAVIISAVVLILLAGLLLLCWRNRRQGQKGFNSCAVETVHTEEEEVHYADTVFCKQSEEKRVNGREEIVYSSVVI